MTDREKLRELITDQALRVHDKEDIILSSGQATKYYVNLKNVLLTKEGFRLIGSLLTEKLKDIHFDSLYGPPTGGLLVALSVMYATGKPCMPASHVVLTEDVITTGKTLNKTIQQLHGNVTKILCVVDRTDPPIYDSLFTLPELLQR